MTAFRLNGDAAQFDDGDCGTPLLYVLRSPAVGDMTPKLGCAREECGACRVLVDGEPAYACTLPADDVAGKQVETAAGLDTPVRRALIESNATQCGYCLPGIIVAAEALFRINPRPSRAEIAEALDSQLCRCGCHPRVIRALLKVGVE